MLSLTLFSMSNSIEAFSFYIASFSIVSINYSENHSFVYSQFQPTEETKVGQLRKHKSGVAPTYLNINRLNASNTNTALTAFM